MEKYDPILTEVHRVKDALAAKYGYDVRKLVKALRASQKRRGVKLVDLSAKRPAANPPARRRSRRTA